MEASPPTSGPEIVQAALTALGEASPSEMADWYRDTFGTDLPVTEGTLRQTVTRLARHDRIHSVPNRHGVYANGPEPPERESLADFRRSQAPAYAAARLSQHPAPAILFTLAGAVGWDINEARFVPVGAPPDLDVDLRSLMTAG